MNNELVIDVSSSEINIALLQNKQLIELNKEKSNVQFTVGDIYLGQVKKIMPGLNAAFVNVGYEKDAFLHYLDLGPRFESLNKYLMLSYSSKNKYVPISKFNLLDDIDKAGKIKDVLSPGQMVVVQIAKEPISSKGPRLTSEISLAGRNLVVMPFSNKVSISQKIKSEAERKRLKNLILSIKPNNYGVILRTVAEGKKVADLDAEMKYLIDRWESAFKKLIGKKPPKLLIGEIDRTSAILRDILNPSFNNIYINNETAYKEVKQYIKEISPENKNLLKLYSGHLPIFDEFGVDKQIKALFGKTVNISNGSYLIIEHTEAMHVIDVNSGNRSVTEATQEANAVDVNTAAAKEIARQVRLRDMGGIIVVDFIDMQNNDHKKVLYEKMKEFMAEDRARHHVLPLTKFGLMQITRQRVRPEMNIKTDESCPCCKGKGNVNATILIDQEIENNLVYAVKKFNLKSVVVKTHPFIQAYLTKGFFSIRRKWSKKHKLKIKILPLTSYQLLEYKIFDINDDEVIF